MAETAQAPHPGPGPAGAPVTLQFAVHAVALALMLGWILYLGERVLVPMVLALMVSYLIAGVARMVGALPGIGPAVPVWLRYLLAALLIGYGLTQMVILFAASATAFAGRLPEYQAKLLVLVQSSATTLGFAGDVSWEMLRRDVLAQINLQRLLQTGLSSTAALVGGLFVVLLNTAFMLLEQRSFQAKLGVMSSDPVRADRVRTVVANVHGKVGHYLAVKTLINILLGLACYAVMWLFGLEFAALMAITIAFLNYIPYLGSWIGTALPVLVALVQFGEVQPALLLLAAMAAIQFVQGSVLEPVIMGNSLDLSPYAILISLTVWTSLWGVPGAIVSIPITAVIVIVLSEFRGARPIVVLLSRNGGVWAEKGCEAG